MCVCIFFYLVVAIESCSPQDERRLVEKKELKIMQAAFGKQIKLLQVKFLQGDIYNNKNAINTK